MSNDTILNNIQEAIKDYSIIIKQDSRTFITKAFAFYGRLVLGITLLPVLGLIVLLLAMSIPGIILYLVIYSDETVDKIFEIDLIEKGNEYILSN